MCVRDMEIKVPCILYIEYRWEMSHCLYAQANFSLREKVLWHPLYRRLDKRKNYSNIVLSHKNGHFLQLKVRTKAMYLELRMKTNVISRVQKPVPCGCHG
jgi:hypothetical protein